MTELETQTTLESLSSNELRDVITDKEARFSKIMALNEFVRRQTSDRTEVLDRVLFDNNAPELEAIAIRVLGLRIDASAQKSLLKKLDSSSIIGKRQVIYSLGKIGDRQAMQALKDLTIQDGDPLASARAFAVRLISFRNGFKGNPIDEKSVHDCADSKPYSINEIPTSPLPAEIITQYSGRICDEVPGLELSVAGAIKFDCMKKEMWLIRNKELELSKGFKKLQNRPYIPMVIMAHAYCTDRPYLYAYVFSQPDSSGVKLFVSRLRGQLTHVGTANLGENNASFELSALKTRFAPGGVIKGQFNQSKEVLTNLNGSTFSKINEARREPRLVQIDLEKSQSIAS